MFYSPVSSENGYKKTGLRRSRVLLFASACCVSLQRREN
jgi:hypothetical protein